MYVQTAKQSVFLRIHVRASTQTKGLERDGKQRARLGRGEVCALYAHKTLKPRFTDFCTDFEKKSNCFAVYIKYGYLVKYGYLLGITFRW